MCAKNRFKVFLLPLLSAIVSSLLTFSPSFADPNPKVPAEYGELIYRCNEKSQCQLFVIGITHRDALSSANGRGTAKAGAEAYKLGEWLIRNHGLELLLPEGFFKKKTAKEGLEARGVKNLKKDGKSLDIGVVEEKLADDKTYVNAEMLLKENYSVRTEQVEDKGLYDAAQAGLRKLVDARSFSSEYLIQKAGLDYLQERRTAAMLQNIPVVIGDVFGNGPMREKRAIFTVGMSHILSIIKYLEEKRIRIFSPLLSSPKSPLEDYAADLNLSRENFGVSIIIPRTLANDPQFLKMNKLDRIVSDIRARSSVRSSSAVLPFP